MKLTVEVLSYAFLIALVVFMCMMGIEQKKELTETKAQLEYITTKAQTVPPYDPADDNMLMAAIDRRIDEHEYQKAVADLFGHSVVFDSAEERDANAASNKILDSMHNYFKTGQYRMVYSPLNALLDMALMKPEFYSPDTTYTVQLKHWQYDAFVKMIGLPQQPPSAQRGMQKKEWDK